MSPRAAALALGTLCAGTALVGAGRPTLWFDEEASLSAIDRTPAEALDLFRSVDAVHVLYYAVLRAWTEVLGTSTVSLRALSALALGAGCAWFVLLVARRYDTPTAALGGLLVVALPGIAWSGLEARPAALSLAACTGSLLALQRAIDRGGRASCLLYGFTVAAMIGFDLMTVLALPVHGLVWGRDRRAVRLGATCWVLALLACAPLLVLAVSQRGQIDWIDHTLWSAVVEAVQHQTFTGPQGGLRAGALVPTFVLGVLTLVLLRLALRRPGTTREAALLGLVWCAVPTLVLVALVVVDVQLYQPRYLTFAMPGLCLALAAGVRATPARATVGAALLVAFVATCLVPLVQLRDHDKRGGDDEALARLARGASSVVLVPAATRSLTIGYPDDFAGARDALLREAPGPSGTLWGVNRPLRSLPTVHGRVVVYVRAFLAVPLHRVLSVPGLAGCSAERTVRTPRTIAAVLRCPT